MSGSPWNAVLRRAMLLAALSVAGFVLMAGPMIWSEITAAPGIWGMRVVVGLICGAIGAPLVIAAAWYKPALPLVVVAFLPPFAAAVFSAMSWSDDYSFTHIAVPLFYVTLVMAYVLLPGRADPVDGKRCPTCNYDLRANPGGRCPECGNDPYATRPLVAWRRRWLINLGWLVLAMAASGIGHRVFLGWLLSLG